MFTIIGSQPHGINYQCILCSKVSPSAPAALSHLETDHLNTKEETSPSAADATQPLLQPYNRPGSQLISDFDILSVTCRFCQKTFKNTKIKRKHEKTVHNDQTIVCFYCFIPILNRTELTKHIKSEHSGSKSLFKCRWCDAHFSSIPKRCTHMRDFHSSDVANITNKARAPIPPKSEAMIQNMGDISASSASQFVCEKCNRSFATMELKLQHEHYVHNGAMMLNCLYCFTSYQNRDHLIQHIGVYHSGKKLFKCKWCEITFETLYQRCVHMREYHGVPSATINQDISRDRCLSEEDILPRAPLKPTDNHHPDLSVSYVPKEPSKLVRNCRFCDSEVTSMILKKHLIEHRQVDHFCCIFCDKTVPTIGGIKSHILRNHPFITTRKIDRAELGSLDVERIANIEKYHKSDGSSRRVALPTNEPPPPLISPETEIVYPCQVCYYVYTITQHVQEHWKVHSDESNEEWTCTLCDEQYGEFRCFKFHIDMHMNDAYTFAQSNIDLQNICGFCNISVETQQSLDGHILIHRSVTEFQCIFCKAKARTYHQIREHISQNHLNANALTNDSTRHLNETPFNSSTFKCSICLKLCNNQFNLNSHTKAHILGGKPCALCKFKFKDMYTLKKHLVLVHGATDEYIVQIETGGGAARSDAVPDYCELCDTTFSSQGKFQKHRRACRDRYQIRSTTSLDDNGIFSLLDGGTNRSRQASAREQDKPPTDLGQTINPDTHIYYEEDSENSSTENMTPGSLDGSDFPMEIPMKSSTDDSLFPMAPSPPHSYNTRKRIRPDSYTNIIPAKMLPFSREFSGSTPEKSVESNPMSGMKRASPVKTPLPANNQHLLNTPLSSSLQANPSTSTSLLDTSTSIHNTSTSSTMNNSMNKSGTEVMYCDVCELHFASNKQLYWHKHTKRHLAMEILAKGPSAVSYGKHLCGQCDQGYNCKKQLHWHRKIAHGNDKESIAQAILKLPVPTVGVVRSPAVEGVVRSPAVEGVVQSRSVDGVACSSLTEHTEPEKHADAHEIKERQIKSEPILAPTNTEDPVRQKPVDIAPKILCPECNLQFENNLQLDAHTDAVHSKQVDVDVDVPEDVPDTSPGTATSPDHTTHGKYYCSLCKIDYKTNKQLYNHKRTLTHIQLAKKYDPSYLETFYKCDECQIDFQSYKQLWNHKKSLQHKEIADKVPCSPVVQKPACSTEGAEAAADPEKMKNFVCLDCDCVFEDKKQMKWHRKTWKHKTITIVPPPHDPATASNDMAAPSHDTAAPPHDTNSPATSSQFSPAREQTSPQMHQDKGLVCGKSNLCKIEDAPYYCQECRTPFKALRAYTVHCKQHLKEGFKCTLCNQKFQFRNYNNVKRHLGNIHKIASDRAKNYMETFHNFDQNAQPLSKVDPADLIRSGGQCEATDPMSPEHISSPQSEGTTPHFIEGLLDNVGLSLELVERKPEWIECAKCKFCKMDFENVPEMLMHVHEEHDKNYHRDFLTQFIDTQVDDAAEDYSSSDDDSDLSDVDARLADSISEDEMDSDGSLDNIALPSIKIKRPGDPLLPSSKRVKLEFGGKSSHSVDNEETEVDGKLEIEADESPSESAHSPKRQYSCILCNTGFTQYLAWWYHSKNEHDFSNVSYYGGTAESKLPGADYKSSSKKNVKAECPDCHAVFNQRLLLEDHLKIHRKPKIFQCDYCCTKFNSCKNASRHRLKCHSILVGSRKRYLCKSCELHFPRPEELIEHVQGAHETHVLNATFCCAMCGKVYNKESTFVSHIRICDPDNDCD